VRVRLTAEIFGLSAPSAQFGRRCRCSCRLEAAEAPVVGG
jgi:hypothetical protein